MLAWKKDFCELCNTRDIEHEYHSVLQCAVYDGKNINVSLEETFVNCVIPETLKMNIILIYSVQYMMAKGMPFTSKDQACLILSK